MTNAHNETRRDSAVAGPRLIAFEMTAACNLKCVHCRACSLEQRAADELSTDECMKFFDDIAALPQKPVLIMTGGEPLIRPDFFELLEYANRLQINKAVATNATMLDEKTANKLAKNGVTMVSVSLDEADPKGHDDFRKVDGAFKMSMSGIENIKAAGLKFQINTTITRKNYSNVAQIYDMALKLGAGAVHIFLLVPTGRAENMKGEEITPGEYEKVLNWFYDKKREAGDKINLKATCAPHYYRIMRQRAKADGIAVTEQNFGHDVRTRGCLAGCGFAFVSSRGLVQGCGYMPISAGNIRQEPFSKIYAESDFFKKLRDFSNIKGKCGSCEYLAVCGGCRARALAESGDCFGEEPYCNYTPKK